MFRKVSMALLLSSIIAFTGCHVTIEDAPEDRAEPALLKDLLPSARSEEPLNELLLKEKDTYQSYLVVGEYNGNILLLRKELTEETMQYAKEAVFGTSPCYYNGSIPDTFLSKEFISVFSEEFQNRIQETNIEITSLDGIKYRSPVNGTEVIQRKIFLLSATELGIKTAQHMTEGTELTGLTRRNMQYLPKSQWLRSPFLAEDTHVWAVNTESVGSENVTGAFAVRPAFCLAEECTVQRKDSEPYVFLLSEESEKGTL